MDSEELLYALSDINESGIFNSRIEAIAAALEWKKMKIERMSPEDNQPVVHTNKHLDAANEVIEAVKALHPQIEASRLIEYSALLIQGLIDSDLGDRIRELDEQASYRIRRRISTFQPYL